MRSPSRGIAADGRRAVLLSGVMAGLLLALAAGGWLLSAAVHAPRLERGVQFARAITDGHGAMLDQETGLRGYQISGDPALLAPYRDGQRTYLEATARAWHLVEGAQLQADLLETERLAVRWQTEHAVPRLATTVPGEGVTTGRGDQGRALFDAYREAHEALLAETRATNNAVLRQTARTAWVVGGLQVVLAVAALVATVLRGRRVQADLVEPVADVTAVLHRLADGDLSARTSASGAPELDALGDAVAAVAASTALAREVAAADRARADARAQVFQQVLGVAHELSGHLERHELVRALLREVEQTARVAQASVHAVVGGRADELLGSRGAHALEVGDLARDAVRQLRLVVDEDGCGAALPLGHGGTVHAVLEVRAPGRLDPDQLLALRSLALAAGGALTAAELHETVRAESRRDALTGLYNRRRFEEDLEHELGLAGRVGVPVSLLLLDVDHFKRFNDTHGHREGDRLLRDLGRLLSTSLRATDSAYRYGGEELAVVLRGATPEEAEDLAERLRSAVEVRLPVTVSVGAVTATDDVGTDAAVEAADRALYAAKSDGRNQVRVGELDVVVGTLVPLQRSREAAH